VGGYVCDAIINELAFIMKTIATILLLMISCSIFAQIEIANLEENTERYFYRDLQLYWDSNQNFINSITADYLNHDSIYKSYGSAFSDSGIKRLNLSGQTHLDYLRKVGELKQLEYLNISGVFTAKWGNSIRKIPNGVYELKELKYLVVNRTNLKKINNKISQLFELEVLSISDGNLKELPDEIVSLSQLKILDISSNAIEKLPENIGILQNLEVLILNNNSLNTIPESIVNLKNLKFLSISPNCENDSILLKNIELISKINSLEILILRNSDIKTLPNCLSNLQNLKHLSLRGNYNIDLSQAFTFIGQKMKNLQLLDLSFTRIKEIPPEIGNLAQIKTLYLGNFDYCCPMINFFGQTPYNDINSLPESVQNMKGLRNLYLWAWEMTEEEKAKIQQLIPNCNIEFEIKRL
jgi:Leucine-rich repeat (LRR) protein